MVHHELVKVSYCFRRIAIFIFGIAQNLYDKVTLSTNLN